MNGLLLLFVGVVLVLQLAIIAMMQRVFMGQGVHRTVRDIGELLKNQNERIAADLKDEIGKGSEAAHAAYKEANSVNVKIEDLNERLLKQQEKQ